MRRMGRVLPISCSVKGNSDALQPALEAGYETANRCVMISISAAAERSFAPGFSLPTTESHRPSRLDRFLVLSESGVQASTSGDGKVKLAGITPTMVAGEPLSVKA